MQTHQKDKHPATTFLRALFKHCESGFINLRFLPSARNLFVQLSKTGTISAILEAHKGENAYFGVATRKDGNGTKGGIIEIPALWVEIDFKGLSEKEKGIVWKKYREFPLQPSFLVKSGGGIHIYWRLKEPNRNIPLVEGYLRGLASYFDGDMVSTDASRILRVPWTLNYKYQPPREAVIEAFKPENEYNLGDFDFLPQVASITEEKSRLPEGWQKELLGGVPEGERNNAIARLAGRYLGKDLSREEILPILLDANSRFKPPLKDEEVIRTFDSVIRTHRRNHPDNEIPDDPEGGKKPGVSLGLTTLSDVFEYRTGPVLVRLAEVEPEAVDWLWSRRIPRRKLTLIIGDPDLGKSILTLDVAARITKGGLFPDGCPAPQGDVILLTTEDGLSDTVRPRLDALGGDPERVHVLKAVREEGIERGFDLRRDLPALETAINQTGAIYVVVDPLSAYLAATDSYRDAEVRRVLAPLADLADRTRVAIVGVMHLTKNHQRQAIYRVQGSLAFVAAARAVFVVAEDREDKDRRLFLPVKLNIAKKPEGLAFKLMDQDGQPVPAWELTPVTIDAETALAPPEPPDERMERGDAIKLLRELLAEGPVKMEEIIRQGRLAGISERTLKRAKRALGVQAQRVGGLAEEGWWEWILPKSAKDGDVALLAKNQQLSIDRQRISPKSANPPLSGTLSRDGGTDSNLEEVDL